VTAPGAVPRRAGGEAPGGPRIPLSTRLLAGATLAADRLAPPLAPPLATRLWFRTIRPPVTAEETAVLRRAERRTVGHPLPGLAAYTWDGPGATVLLVHGWSSHAGQMTAFVPPLLERGFRVVAFDAPAHGRSPGRRTDIFEIRDALLGVAERFGPPAGVVTHSLGGLAFMAAAARERLARAVVLVSPGLELRALVDAFAGRIGLSERSARELEARVEALAGRALEEVRPHAMEARALVVHDRDDPDIPLAEGRRVAEALPDGRLLATEGLGHRRILRDPAVVEAAADFLEDALRSRREPMRRPLRLLDG